MTVWIVFYYDLTHIVDGIFATELEARRSLDGGGEWKHVREVALPCDDLHVALRVSSDG